MITCMDFEVSKKTSTLWIQTIVNLFSKLSLEGISDGSHYEAVMCLVFLRTKAEAKKYVREASNLCGWSDKRIGVTKRRGVQN